MKTSYFAKVGYNLYSVAICLYKPLWFNGRWYPKLAPTSDLLSAYKCGIINDGEYTDIYKKAVLSNLDPHKVLDDLGTDAILLCFEGPNKFCHRHLVAEWLMEHCNIIIEEL